jgi:Domain of unknown function (DUF4375)
MTDDPTGEAVPPDRAAELRDRVRRGMADLRAQTRAQAETPLTVAEIESLVDDDLDDRVWCRLSSLIDYLDASQIASEDADVAAYLATRVFEWEVGNGGLHQYFFNFPDPDHLALVLGGYDHLGLAEARHVIEDVVAPLAEAEAAWREQRTKALRHLSAVLTTGLQRQDSGLGRRRLGASRSITTTTATTTSHVSDSVSGKCQ